MISIAHPFGDCKTAVLQHIGSVQSNGALVAIHWKSNVIEYCSANAATLLGVQPEQLLGRTGAQWLSTGWPGLARLAGGEGDLDWSEFGSDPLIALGHSKGAYRIFEFERPVAPCAGHWWNHAARTRFIEGLTAVHTAEECRHLLVDHVFERSGYDRVMMYRFLADWNGEVMNERCRPAVGGFVGLRFPAADIPPNARQMFTVNWQRTIVDVDAQTSPVLRWTEDSEPLDLTYSTLRSAHPAHLQYLKNMGVHASMTLSVVVQGKLWGLVACHHLSARAVPVEDRLAFEEMARLVSLHLTNLLGLIDENLQSEMRQKLSRVQGAMSAAGDDVKFALSNNLGMIRQTFGAGGAWLRFEGEDFFVGVVPDKVALAPLRDLIELFPREVISHYDVLPESLQPFPALAARASGLLFVPLDSSDFIALVRPEVLETVNWAGKPEAAERDAGLAARPLTPRHSFAQWSERVRNTSEKWTATELESGEKLRVDLQLFLSTARLEQIALHDPLTGLANRLLFERRLQREVRNAMSQNGAFAVYMIDLDRFKQVNDTLGHGAGDQVLVEVAARLVRAVRPGDTVARLGGDEFAIIQTGLDDNATASLMAARIVQSVSRIYNIGGQTVDIGASVGVSLCPADTVEENELLECADLALYQVKRSGRNAYSLYAPAMRIGEASNSTGERLLRALRDDEFRLSYQPVVDARSGNLRGLEAFLRWHQPGAAEMAAGEFMALVEQKRLGQAVAEWVMDAVFSQYREWVRQELPMVPVTINVGNAEFATQDLLGQIEKCGARYKTGWRWLRLDIKEQALVADVKYAIRKLRHLREGGVGAHLDNFGRGFVPLGHLTQLPFQGIKLDARLFEQGNSRQHFNALFNVVQSIAQVFSAQLTVTKIETSEMSAMLRHQHVDLQQGYAIARPADAAQATEWLRNPYGLLPQPDTGALVGAW